MMARSRSLEDAIEDVLVSVDDAEAVAAVCAVCVQRLPCDGAAVIVMSSDAQRETVYASDDAIDTFEQVQYNLGEGPSWVAFRERKPVLVADLRDRMTAARWPMLVGQVAHLSIASAFCFPMRFGGIDVGVCTLYRRDTGSLSPEDVAGTLDAIEIMTLALLDLRGDGQDPLLVRWLPGDGNRREVHQATGMVMGQLRVSAEVAFARLRASAFSEGCSLEEIAHRVVSRQAHFEVDAQ